MRIPAAYAHRKARIEIIPLIDIVFFLLATFVMVSLSMVKNSGIPVDLPAAASSAPRQEKSFTTLTVNERGEVFFDKQPVTMAALPGRLAALKASTREPLVLINADERADFGGAVAVLDAVRKAGIRKVSIQTEAPEK